MNHSRTASRPPDVAKADGMHSLVVEAARRARDQLAELAEAMADTCHQRIPDLPAEGEAALLLRDNCRASAQNLLDVFDHRIPLDRVSVPAVAAHYARLVAQSDVPVEAVLRAHRTGEEVFRRYWVQAAAEQEPVGVLPLEFVQHTDRVMAGYSDRICQRLADIYDEEHRRWTQRATESRADQVRALLSNTKMTSASAEALIGHRMRGFHLGIVAWVETPEHAHALHATTAAVLADVPGRARLVVPANECTLWAWVSGPTRSPVDRARLEAELRRRNPPVRLALARPAADLAGFRASHHDACAARRVATCAGHGSRVTVFSEVALSGFLATDLPLARRWINTVLGGLAANDDATAELRRTVLTFLQTGASLTETARLLHLHKNTVRYRLRKAEQLRGVPLNQDPRDLETALLACAQLGIPSDSAIGKSRSGILE
jgi:DNA-binding PucR family transcriptional regulator